MSDFINKATGGWPMAVHMNQAAVSQEPAQSSTAVHEIDTDRYAFESYPKGYIRVVQYEEDQCPSCPDPGGEKFHNER